MAATVAQTLVIRGFGSVIRLIAGVVIGLAITAALFWMMPYMIENTDRQLDETGSANLVDFVRLRRTETIHRRELKPAKPPVPQTPPPLPSAPPPERRCTSPRWRWRRTACRCSRPGGDSTGRKDP